tara:strand:+ start:124 stop:432 length:309 start_codon:yes stop_codon:yes gene_type:complete
MIFLAWMLNAFFALVIALLLRKLFSNIIFKRISYATFLSLFVTIWFISPGSKEMAPILSIYFIDLLETGNFLQMRLIRPLLLVFSIILILDLFLFRYKSRKK